MRFNEKIGRCKHLEIGIYGLDRIYFRDDLIFPRIENPDELITVLKKIHAPREALNIKLFFTSDEDYQKFSFLDKSNLANGAKLYLESAKYKMNKLYPLFNEKAFKEVCAFNCKLLSNATLPSICYNEIFDVPVGNRKSGLYNNSIVCMDKVVKELMDRDTQALNFSNPNYCLSELNYYKNDINSAYPYFLINSLLPAGIPLKKAPKEAHTTLYVIKESYDLAPLVIYEGGGSGADANVIDKRAVIWEDELRFRKSHFLHYSYKVIEKRYFILKVLKSNCAKIYDLKEKAPKGSLERNYYKYCLNMPIGKLAARIRDGKDTHTGYYPIASYIWMKQRVRMLEYAYRIGINNVLCIATDEIDTLTPLTDYKFIHYSNKCGDFKCEYKEKRFFVRGNLIYDSNSGAFDKHSGYKDTEDIIARTIGDKSYMSKLAYFYENRKNIFNEILKIYAKYTCKIR